MAIGPFSVYAPPGVYTQTSIQAPVGQLLGGLRIPALIGTGQESLAQDGIELIRGSSSIADTPIFNEDVSSRWVTGGAPSNPTLGNQNGNLFRFRVRNYPIVDGNGTGTTTFEANKVTVTVNGSPVIVAAVDGTNGIVTLLIAPQPLDTVLTSYYFHRKDTRITDDVSEQVTDGLAVLRAPRAENYTITAGTNDIFQVFVNDGTTIAQVTFSAGILTAAQVANEINAAAISGLTASTTQDNQGFFRVQLIAISNVQIGNGTANGALGFNVGDYSNRNRNFRVFNGPIVDGSNGGITTTDPSKVVVKIDNVQVLATSVDGANQTVTLGVAPPSSSTVTIEYYFNTFQDTFDYLPNNNIVEVGNVGISPGRRDYLNGPDFIVINQGDQSIIQWGTAWQVVSGIQTGVLPFDGTQIVGLLVDNRIFAAETTRFTNTTTNVVSSTEFTLPLKPTTGNGRDTPLGVSLYQTITNGRIDLPTNRPDLVLAYVGRDVRDALSRPAVQVSAVDSSTNRIVLKNPVPPDSIVYATFWYNTIADDNYTFKVITPGPTGVGQYSIASELQGADLLTIKFGTKTALPQTVQFPSGSEKNPDTIHFGGNPVPETATITFSTQSATHACFTADGSEPYDIYSVFSQFADIIVDGVSVNAGAGVNLSLPFAASLASEPISNPLALVFSSTNKFTPEFDGFIYSSVSLFGLTTVATVADAINNQTVIDLANQLKAKFNFHLIQTGVHLINDVVNTVVAADATSLATSFVLLNAIQAAYNSHRTAGLYHPNSDIVNVSVAPVAVSFATAVVLANELKTVFDAHRTEFSIVVNGNVHLINDTVNFTTCPLSGTVATVVPYAAEQILLLKSLTVPSTFQSLSRVAIRIPTGVGDSDASALIGFTPNTVVNGDIAAINQPAVMVGGRSEPFNITASVTDQFRLNVDATDYTVFFAGNTSTPVSALVTYVNNTAASVADIATATATLVTLSAEIQTDYSAHISNTGGVWHAVADAVNIVTAALPVDLATSITALNELKIIFNAHRSNTGGAFHTNVDGVNTVASPNAIDLPSSIVLAAELKAKLNTHEMIYVVAGNVHATDDVINDVTSPNVLFANPIAYSGTGPNVGKLVLRSFINTPGSLLIVNNGSSNSIVGFSNGASTGRTQPDANDIQAALNDNAGFIAVAVAHRTSVVGLGGFLEICSLTTGTTSTIAFGGAAGSVFIPDTGFGIVIGTSGDSGEAARSGYNVTSSDPINGSLGSGIPGQTYTDARTGLRFTILPASAGDYAAGGSFTFLVGTVFTADSAIPIRSVNGVEISVLNTINMGVDTTAVVTTYQRTGAEPSVGDIYYISYKYAKSDLTAAVFRDLKKIQTNFGPPTPEFPLSLGARLAILNGAVLVILRQVLRAPNSGQASSASFAAAIDELKKPLPGNIKPDVIAPLSTDPTVFAYLNQHCIFMSSPRQEGERIGIVGTAVGTTPLGVQSIAQGINSELMVVMYPDAYVLTTQDQLGNDVDQLVDGSFVAAAMAGSATSPALDVATPWTRRSILGFKRIGRLLDPTEANQTAVAGVTVVEQVDTGMRIRHGLTTNLLSVITRTPSVITTIQFVQQQLRAALDPYIGQKFTGAVIKAAEDAIRGTFQTLITNTIVSQVAGISAAVDENDPTVMRASAIYVPIFPLEYIVVQLSIRIRL